MFLDILAGAPVSLFSTSSILSCGGAALDNAGAAMVLSPYAVLRPVATAGRFWFPALLDTRFGAVLVTSLGVAGPRLMLLAARVTLRVDILIKHSLH